MKVNTTALSDGKEQTPEVVQKPRGPIGSAIDWIRRKTNSIVANSPLPSNQGLGYDSTMNIYGARLEKKNDGRLVYNRLGLANRIDVAGDSVLRITDDNRLRRPLRTLFRHPKAFAKLTFGRGKRYRGSIEEILANVRRLGLEDCYGPTANRNEIEVKDTALYTHGIALQDIYRQEQIGHAALKGIDRFQALEQAGKYLGEIHAKHGAVGEFNLYHVLFREKGTDGKVSKPAQTLPDIVWNPKRKIAEIDKKATDVLDLLASTACEEFRRSKDGKLIARALDSVLLGYADQKVLETSLSYVRRGRLTLPPQSTSLGGTPEAQGFLQGVFGQHNVQRLGFDKEAAAGLHIRQVMSQACERRLATIAKPTPSK